MADASRAHVRIPNRILEALLDASFTGTQLKIVLGLIRLTLGWHQSNVTIRVADLAESLRLSPKGGFRRDLRELIAEGVVIEVDHGVPGQPHSLAIEPDFTRWGKYQTSDGRLERMWGRRTPKKRLPRRVTVPPVTPEGANPTGSPPETLEGHRQLPSGVTATGAKCDTPPQLHDPKERKDRKERTTSPRTARGEKAAGPSVTWITPFADAWRARFGGEMAVDPALKPLRQAIVAHGEAEVLRRWRIYLDRSSGEYQPSARKFASTWTEWSGEGGTKPAAPNGVPPMAQLIAALSIDHGLTTYDLSDWTEREARALADPRVTDPDAVREAIYAAKPWLITSTGGFFARDIAARLAPARAS